MTDPTWRVGEQVQVRRRVWETAEVIACDYDSTNYPVFVKFRDDDRAWPHRNNIRKLETRSTDVADTEDLATFKARLAQVVARADISNGVREHLEKEFDLKPPAPTKYRRTVVIEWVGDTPPPRLSYGHILRHNNLDHAVRIDAFRTEWEVVD